MVSSRDVLVSVTRSRDHLVHLAEAKAALARILGHLVRFWGYCMALGYKVGLGLGNEQPDDLYLSLGT